MEEKEYLNILELSRRGEYLCEIGNYKKANDIFEEAIELDPINIDILYKKAHCNVMLDNLEEAIKIYKKILILDKKQAKAYWFIGIINFKKNNAINECLENINKAIYYGYDIPYIYKVKGIILEIQKKYDDAMRCYNLAIKKDSSFYNARVRKGKLYEKLNKISSAIKCYDEIIVNNPDIYIGYYEKALILISKERIDEAKIVIDNGLNILPNNRKLINLKLQINKIMKKYDDSIDLIDKIIKEKDIDLIVEKAILLGLKNKPLEGLEFIKKNIDIQDYNDRINYCVSDLYKKINDYENAAKHLLPIIEGKENKLNYRQLALYQYALMLKKQNKEEYIKYFNMAINEYRLLDILNPEDINIKILRSLCLKQLEKYEEALEYIDYILLIDEKSSQAYALKGIILEEMGEESKAKQLIEKSKILNKDINLDFFRE